MVEGLNPGASNAGGPCSETEGAGACSAGEERAACQAVSQEAGGPGGAPGQREAQPPGRASASAACPSSPAEEAAGEHPNTIELVVVPSAGPLRHASRIPAEAPGRPPPFPPPGGTREGVGARYALPPQPSWGPPFPAPAPDSVRGAAGGAEALCLPLQGRHDSAFHLLDGSEGAAQSRTAGAGGHHPGAGGDGAPAANDAWPDSWRGGGALGPALPDQESRESVVDEPGCAEESEGGSCAPFRDTDGHCGGSAIGRDPTGGARGDRLPGGRSADDDPGGRQEQGAAVPSPGSKSPRAGSQSPLSNGSPLRAGDDGPQEVPGSGSRFQVVDYAESAGREVPWYRQALVVKALLGAGTLSLMWCYLDELTPIYVSADLDKVPS